VSECFVFCEWGGTRFSIILFRPKNGGKSEKKKLEKIQKGEKTPEQQQKAKQKKKGERENKTVFGRAKNALARRVQKSSLRLCQSMLVIKE
jgi:hypothetical protein